jgi:hypothetical protein
LAPADRNQYGFINLFDTGVTGGIYQDIGPMLASQFPGFRGKVGDFRLARLMAGFFKSLPENSKSSFQFSDRC